MEDATHIEQRKEAIRKFLKNKEMLLLLIILLFAFAIRIYFLFTSQSQALWWDEAEYMATAKHWALGIPYEINAQRPPLFQLLGALLVFLHTSELLSKFLLVVFPSTLMVFITYLLGKELFDKKVGFFAAAASSVMWSYLFWSTRFQPDFFSLSFQMLSLFFFWKTFKSESTKYAALAGCFAALGFYFKISALLIPVIILMFALFKDGFTIIKKKTYWIALGAFIITLIPFFIYQYVLYGNPIAFAPSYADPEISGRAGRALGWMTFDYFLSFPKTLFFLLFCVGAFLSLTQIFLIGDLYFKQKERRLDPQVFTLIALIVIAGFYLLYIKGTIEDRWILLITPFIFFLSAKGVLTLISYTKKYSVYLPTIIMILLFCSFGYAQLKHTSDLITLKKDSYSQIKEAGLWIQQNSIPSDVVLSVSLPQTIYYSERETHTYSELNQSSFFALVKEKQPRYLLISVLEPHHPQWIFDWPTNNSDKIVMRKVFLYNNQQPVAAVYEFDKNFVGTL